MTATQLYAHFGLPRNLQHHMQRVAAVGEHLSQNCTEDVVTADIISALLLHDLGNVLKFDFSMGLHLLDEDERDITRWQDLKDQLAAKYGADVHHATLMMSMEANVSTRVLELVRGMGSSQLQYAFEEDDWDMKIACYSDFRVDPQGFTSLESRYDDILARYTARKTRPVPAAKILNDRKWAFRVEQQLKNRLLISLDDLPEESLAARARELADWDFEFQKISTRS